MPHGGGSIAGPCPVRAAGQHTVSEAVPENFYRARRRASEAAHGYWSFCNRFPVESASVRRYPTDAKLGEVIVTFPLTPDGLAASYRVAPLLTTVEVIQTLAVYYVDSMAAEESLGGNDLARV